MLKNLFIIMLTLGVIGTLAGQSIDWDSFTCGGVEDNDPLKDGDVLLTSALNRGTSSFDKWEDTDVTLYSGYRWINLDLREPQSWIEDMDTIVDDPFFLVSWDGLDTFDGDMNWGIYIYDIEYSINDTLSWTDWLDSTELTEAFFGPSDPVDVATYEDDTFYFRVKAYDYATNEGDFLFYDSWVVYEKAPLSFNIVSGSSWSLTDTLIIGWQAPFDDVHIPFIADADTLASMDAANKIVLRNEGTDALRIYLGAESFAWDTNFTRRIWELDTKGGIDLFGIRGILDDGTLVPSPDDFDETKTSIIDAFVSAEGDKFGLSEGILEPNDTSSAADSTKFNENLWLQMYLPMWSMNYDYTSDIRFQVKIKTAVIVP